MTEHIPTRVRKIARLRFAPATMESSIAFASAYGASTGTRIVTGPAVFVDSCSNASSMAWRVINS